MFLLNSCNITQITGIEKRIYRPGFYVQKKQSEKDIQIISKQNTENDFAIMDKQNVESNSENNDNTIENNDNTIIKIEKEKEQPNAIKYAKGQQTFSIQ